ncbi:MAG: universal stress protein, partial [Gemmatimonadota bacterium]|nr:universal stress protein [Gemmatimonadota bacterium]
RHLLVAADESAEGRTAIRAALDLANRARAAVTVLTVVEGSRGTDDAPAHLEELRALVRNASGAHKTPLANMAVAFGLPGIEIVRFAEENEVDLVVAGRKHRSDVQRLMIGDTADSVARRSSVPCLFVPTGDPRLDHILIALNGGDRGLAILGTALEFARAAGGKAHVVSVEPAYSNEVGVTPLITGRSERLLQAIEDARRSPAGGGAEWEGGEADHSGPFLVVHRGDVVEAIVEEARRSAADILVIGYRRGGPAGAIEAGSIARRLMHVAPCAVLTVPL